MEGNPHIQKYFCPEHEGKFDQKTYEKDLIEGYKCKYATLGWQLILIDEASHVCEKCHNHLTKSTGIKYCDGCSALFQMCYVCGKREDGTMMEITPSPKKPPTIGGLPSITACVGETRINWGEWYGMHGVDLGAYALCQWCWENGCGAPDTHYKVTGDEPIGNCNCDCSQKGNHPHIQKYTCVEHPNGFDIEAHHKKFKKNNGHHVGGWANAHFLHSEYSHLCEQCDNHRTDSAEVKYCDGCSALFQVCYVCGNK
jgi:hypothetical protein